jgi:site-specific DNA-methyltransferase (adenine-specific)
MMLELNKIYCGDMYEIKDIINKIHCCDCLEFMKQIPDKSIDLTITSPPYDNLRDYQGYSFDFEGIAKELFRITKEGGVVVWVVGDATVNGSETGTSFKQALYFKEIGFNLHDTMIWRRRTTPQNSNRYEPAFEYMFILSKGKIKTFNPIKEKAKYQDKRERKNYHRDNKDESKFSSNNFKKYEMTTKENIWDLSNRGNDDIAHQHPAIFPEKLAGDHITSWSNKGDLILDPMNGSGTTTKMAKLLGRNFIGIEISQKYCDIANQRLRQDILI